VSVCPHFSREEAMQCLEYEQPTVRSIREKETELKF